MRYPDLVDLIQAAAETVNPAGFFWHGPASDASLNYEQPFPQVHSYTGTHTKMGGVLRYNVLMAFYGQDEKESNSDQTLAIQAEMQILADHWEKAFRDTVSVQIVGGIQMEPLTKKGLIIGSGWALRFSVEAIEECL